MTIEENLKGNEQNPHFNSFYRPQEDESKQIVLCLGLVKLKNPKKTLIFHLIYM